MNSFQNIADRVSIADILRDHGIDVPGETGRIACPIHNGRNKTAFSFKRGVYYCFNCGAKGTHIDLVCALRGNCSRPEALNWLEAKSGIKLNGDRESVIKPPKPKPHKHSCGLLPLQWQLRMVQIERDGQDRRLRLLSRKKSMGPGELADYYDKRDFLEHDLNVLDEQINSLTYDIHQLQRGVN